MNLSDEQIIGEVSAWLQSMVVGLDLCPFAPKVISSGELSIRVLNETDPATVLEQFYQEVLKLLPDQGDGTTLVVLPSGFESFDAYLDLLDLAQGLIKMQELDHEIQIASFHPAYVFEGASENDVANYTNRSPYPILHLLQEQSVTRAVDSYPDAAGISDRNIEKLHSLGLDAVLELQAQLSQLHNN